MIGRRVRRLIFPADQTSWHGFAESVSDGGFPALTFDFRDYGRSDNPREIELSDRGEERTILIGASMAGTAALIVGTRRLETADVAAASAPPVFMDLDSTDAIRSLTVPVRTELLESIRETGQVPS